MRFRVPEFTDLDGKVWLRPKRSDFDSVTDWLRADCAFNDRVASAANAAFERRFRRAVAAR